MDLVIIAPKSLSSIVPKLKVAQEIFWSSHSNILSLKKKKEQVIFEFLYHYNDWNVVIIMAE